MKKIILIFIFFGIAVGYCNAQFISKEDSSKIQQIFYYFEGKLPGAMISIIENGSEVYFKSFGLADNETKEPLTRNHYFYLTSMGKIYTTIAILKLVEMNKLSLDESLNDIFTDFPEYGKNVKIKNLLSHTSGLIDYDPSIINTNEELLRFLYDQDSLKIETGSQWLYSNSDYPMLASIIEKRAKMDYRKFIKKYIFKKLKTNKKQFIDELSNDLIVKGYKEKSWNFTLINDPYGKIYGEKGVFLTLDDLIKTENAIFYNKNNPVMNYQNVFNKVQLSNTGLINYGLGWYIVPQDKENPEKTIYWIGGRDHGFQTVLVHFPEENLSVIILINRDQMYNSIIKMAVEIGKLALD